MILLLFTAMRPVFSFPICLPLSLFIDLDECSISNGGCHVDANCQNTAGSFNCICKTGHNGNGLNCVGEKIIHNKYQQPIVAMHLLNKEVSRKVLLRLPYSMINCKRTIRVCSICFIFIRTCFYLFLCLLFSSRYRRV